jgi:Domain of unknown function (DUF4032)/Lipopolysaccharide kinase (Kdo/WaaP) family
MALLITTGTTEAGLLDLPWQIALADWPEHHLATLPRGISRHVVRFVRIRDCVLAVKEIDETLGRREYELLRRLRRDGLPVVEPIGIVSGRTTPDGSPLDPALVTRHLQFSLPYRALFSRSLRADTASRLVDALAVLLVRLHLAGFYWGDVSLSNTLFRRDAGAFAAYLVDAETGDLHQTLSNGQRAYDLDLARTNIAGELMDLQAGELLDATLDPVELSDVVVARYQELWAELTHPESFEPSERWRVDDRIRRLNDLGFDVAELTISTDIDGTSIEIEPKVVDAGHHSRRLLRLTGLDVEENQARRLLNDLDTFRAELDLQGEDEEIVAHQWVSDCFERTLKAVPRDLRGKLESAEVYHEILEHRWYLSEQLGHGLSRPEAAARYVTDVLVHKPDEASVLGVDTDEIPVVADDPPGFDR